MSTITYHRLLPEDKLLSDLVAEWYFSEWKMEKSNTVKRMAELPASGIPFHLVMEVDNQPVAAGGLAHHVSLLSHEPRLKVYQPWLALVYVTPENQNKGYGTLLCHKIEEMARALGINEYFLFTYTAEQLYTKLGWEIMERLFINEKALVVMKKQLI